MFSIIIIFTFPASFITGISLPHFTLISNTILGIFCSTLKRLAHSFLECQALLACKQIELFPLRYQIKENLFMFLHHVLFIKSNFDRLAEIDNVVMGSFGIYTTPALPCPALESERRRRPELRDSNNSIQWLIIPVLIPSTSSSFAGEVYRSSASGVATCRTPGSGPKKLLSISDTRQAHRGLQWSKGHPSIPFCSNCHK